VTQVSPGRVTLRLYDSRRGGVFPIEGTGSGPLGVYACGITPYAATHVGHAFTYLAVDVLIRALRVTGRAVRYVQNLTDVDDDMLRHAREEGEGWQELADRNAERFMADMTALNWSPPDVYPAASAHVRQVVAMVATLLRRGEAYRAGGHVYAAFGADPTFGDLGRVPVDERLAIAGDRGNDPDLPGKRHPLDPVLWQPSAPDEPSWPSPWGPGRPGWHIECSAMSMAYLGPKIAIHAGGADLAFPHHDAERMQSEAATGQRPFVGHWMHTGMVEYTGTKMSKSLGNLVFVGDLLAQWPADVVRLALVSHHYRSTLAWSDALLIDAAARASRWSVAAAQAEKVGDVAPAVAAGSECFWAAMADDLDTPAAAVALDDLAALTPAPGASSTLRELATRVVGLRLAGAP